MTTADTFRLATLGWVLVTAPGAVFAGTDVPVNGDLPGTVQNEFRITHNATDAANFVVAYNDSIGAASTPLGVSFSVDGGDLDLVLHWCVRHTGIACGDTETGLTGQTTGGQPFSGSDSLVTAGCR